MAQRLDGTVALVTGASSGIGEATALTLAAHGASVALVARRLERLQEVARLIKGHSGKAMAIQADVTNKDQVASMVQQVVNAWKHIHILVNDSGVMLLGPVLGADVTDWERMVSTNLMGVLYVTHEVLPIMMSQGSGDIVGDLGVVHGHPRRWSGGGELVI